MISAWSTGPNGNFFHIEEQPKLPVWIKSSCHAALVHNKQVPLQLGDELRHLAKPLRDHQANLVAIELRHVLQGEGPIQEVGTIVRGLFQLDPRPPPPRWQDCAMCQDIGLQRAAKLKEQHVHLGAVHLIEHVQDGLLASPNLVESILSNLQVFVLNVSWKALMKTH